MAEGTSSSSFQLKDYTHVSFEHVKEFYVQGGEPVECTLKFKQDLVNTFDIEKDNDFVGIFKVGFTNCKDYLTVHHFDAHSIKDHKIKIHFDDGI
jgi:hypothetical protein